VFIPSGHRLSRLLFGLICSRTNLAESLFAISTHNLHNPEGQLEGLILQAGENRGRSAPPSFVHVSWSGAWS
jgi:hypothetical protein